MIKENFKKAIVALGVAATVATGIILFNSGERDFLTWDESRELIRQYNLQLQLIKNDCENDTRCKLVGGQKRVIFEGLKSEKEIPRKLNEWIADGNDPKYKR